MLGSPHAHWVRVRSWLKLIFVGVKRCRFVTSIGYNWNTVCFGIGLKCLLHADATVCHKQNRHDPSSSFMTVPNSHEQVYI